MAITPKISEAIRRDELRAQVEVMQTNDRFAAFTTSTAFSLSLSRSMIVALCLVEQALRDELPIVRFPISDSGLNGIERRGLIERWAAADATPGEVKWSDIIKITKAGNLVLDLLAEAALIEPRILRQPLPPPPPGWLDPRPKLNLAAGTVEPSDRAPTTTAE